MGTEFSAPIIFYVIQFIYIFVWWGLGSHRQPAQISAGVNPCPTISEILKFHLSNNVEICAPGRRTVTYSLAKRILTAEITAFFTKTDTFFIKIVQNFLKTY